MGTFNGTSSTHINGNTGLFTQHAPAGGGLKLAIRAWAATITCITSDTTEIADGWSFADPAHFTMAGSAQGHPVSGAGNAPLPVNIFTTTPTFSLMKGSLTLGVKGATCTITVPVVFTSLGLSRNSVEGDGSWSFVNDGNPTLGWT